MTQKIFRSTLLVAAVVLLASLAIVLGGAYSSFSTAQENRLRDELRLAACGVEAGGRDYLERLAAPGYRAPWDCRLTWVASDGTVLFDTADSAGAMDNHGDRAEIREALAQGESSGVRYSDTLTQRTLYCARTLGDGTVLRVSVGEATALALVLDMLRPILAAGLLAVVLSAALARGMAKKIVRPLNALDLDRPLENDAYEELAPLLRRIHQQRGQIDAQLQELRARTDEFAQVTGHMNEGLVLLDRAGKVLSINPAARRIFGADTSCHGQAFSAVDASAALRLAVQRSLEEGHSQARAERGGREYQFDISRIERENQVMGTVLLAFDVTGQAQAERSRREFTANVSHELKTPLQSILGSAELLKNGLVMPEDIPRFSGLIHAETARLVAVVDDIINLSRLDEERLPEGGPVNLLDLAEQAADALSGSAEKKGVRISAAGDPVLVHGVDTFLYELVYNLCDNAVKYNVENGWVELAVSATDQGAELSVRDGGIGIPPEYHSRVFERFFRVDKSRSKASGGTGLGLSIVKHVAQYHHAAVRLRSHVGEGTEVTITFPQA